MARTSAPSGRLGLARLGGPFLFEVTEMATTTTVQNPFDPQAQKVTNPGIIGGAITNVNQGASANNLAAPIQYNPLSGLNIQQYAARESNVNPETETAAGQLDSILAKDSPLMRRARTIASQNMNQRGLINSSMAQGAGVAAMIDRATPIAQQDAETYSNRSLANMGAVNTANQFNVGQNNALFGQGLGIAADYAKQIQGQGFQTSERTATQEFTAAQSALERAQQIALTDKSLAAQENLQKAQQDFNAAQANLDRLQQTSERVAIQSYQSSESALDRAQQTALQTAQQNFTEAQAELDRAQQITLTDKSITAQKDLQTAQQNFIKAQAELDRAQQVTLTDKSITAQKDLQTAQQNFIKAQAELDRAQQITLTDKSITAQKDLQTAQQNFTKAQAELDRAQQVTLTDKSITAQQNLQTAQQNFQTTQNALDRAQQTAITDKSITAQQNLQTAQQNFQSAQNELDRAQQIALTDKSITAQQNLQTAQQNFQSAQNALDRAQQITLTDKSITAQKDLQSLQQSFQGSQNALDRASSQTIAEFQNNLQKSNASDSYKATISINTLNALNAIALDPNLDAAAKAAAITNVTNGQTAALNYGETLYKTTATASASTQKAIVQIASVADKSVEEKLDLYRSFRKEGMSDSKIRSLVEDSIGVRMKDADWNILKSMAGYGG
ncbi:hypothetical protein EBQ81_01045 [bacterium]|nr:hypothetical protein [bacterium]